MANWQKQKNKNKWRKVVGASSLQSMKPVWSAGLHFFFWICWNLFFFIDSFEKSLKKKIHPEQRKKFIVPQNIFVIQFYIEFRYISNKINIAE